MTYKDKALKRSNKRVVSAGRETRNGILKSVLNAIKGGASTYEEVCKKVPNTALSRVWVDSLLSRGE